MAWSAGLLLIAGWGIARGLAAFLAARDLRRFHEVEVTASSPPPLSATAAAPVVLETGPVDQRLWAEERVRAFARAAREPAPPPLAVLRIPKIGLEVPVLAGTEEWTLDRGVGWVEATARPGEPGNVAIAGHRDGFFRGLKEIRTGDAIEVATPGGRRSYRVDNIRIVRPDDVRVLEPTAAPTLTLITCYPFYFVGSAPKRYIVRATLAGTGPEG